ncbi:hypothetical protein O6H91_08G048700 [Diphasiastrum complanatum]|uniref:Uncharacterized protein n=1 Tax=Diphasiastrum complanatum TaxID=34168 RepID=A0ACC2CXB5_DIPCM|nr:hypothetical protein O6H91_08G048700 [Diphasiastrum complanatum]
MDAMESTRKRGGSAAWRRTSVLANHLSAQTHEDATLSLERIPCLAYNPPETASVKGLIDVVAMRQLMDGHDVDLRDEVYNLMANEKLFQLKKVGGQVYVGPDYNEPFQLQRYHTMQRIYFLRDKGLFKGELTDDSFERAFRKLAIHDCLAIFDHSLGIKLGVHFQLWGGAVKYLGTQRHHDRWLQDTEDYVVKGCFAMTELGHGSNVRGIETVATYDPSTKEFIICTPCESAQKYWIGGAAEHATHVVVFSQLHINGKNEGVHAFIAQIRDEQGRNCSGVRIVDCGHKIGLNGVDNGRIWFDNVRVPQENLLNSVSDVTPEGHYVSSISDPDHRFGAFLAPLTAGRVTISVSGIYQSKLGLATAIRYALTRRAFSLSPNEPEVLLLDYPSHQRRLLPLLAKTYVMSCAANDLKKIYVKRTPSDSKIIHVLSSSYKAMFTWHNIRTLQECREACGGQGLKTDNKIGQLKAEFDVQLTFEGDNNVLMQQVSKALIAEYLTSKKKGKPLKGLGLEHINGPPPVLSSDAGFSLRDKNFQIALFHLRERDLLQRLAQRVTQLTSKGSSTTDALVLSHQLAEDLGWAFTERAILEIFLSVEKEAAGPNKDILALLRSLFVLVLLDEEPVFLRYEYLSPQQSRAIQEEISKLCSEIRPYSLALVDSFGFPSSFLGPIASDWIEANSWKNV